MIVMNQNELEEFHRGACLIWRRERQEETADMYANDDGHSPFRSV